MGIHNHLVAAVLPKEGIHIVSIQGTPHLQLIAINAALGADDKFGKLILDLRDQAAASLLHQPQIQGSGSIPALRLRSQGSQLRQLLHPALVVVPLRAAVDTHFSQGCGDFPALLLRQESIVPHIIAHMGEGPAPVGKLRVHGEQEHGVVHKSGQVVDAVIQPHTPVLPHLPQKIGRPGHHSAAVVLIHPRSILVGVVDLRSFLLRVEYPVTVFPVRIPAEGVCLRHLPHDVGVALLQAAALPAFVYAADHILHPVGIFMAHHIHILKREVSVENQKQKIGNGAVSHGVVTSAQVPILTAAESHLRRTVSAVKPLSV